MVIFSLLSVSAMAPPLTRPSCHHPVGWSIAADGRPRRHPDSQTRRTGTAAPSQLVPPPPTRPASPARARRTARTDAPSETSPGGLRRRTHPTGRGSTCDPLTPQSRLRGSPPSAIVPSSQVNGFMVSALARPDSSPFGARCCTRCWTSPTQPGVPARCSHPARSGPTDPTAAGSARRCDDAGRHVPGAHDADRANPGTRAIGQRNCTRVGGRQGHARPGPLLLGQRRQDVERASRVPARAASRCRSPLTSRCPVGQERRRERGGEHRLERQRRAGRRCSRRRLWPAREGQGKTPPMRRHPPDRCPAVSRRRRGRRCGRGRR
jgi:hypothetical protein